MAITIAGTARTGSPPGGSEVKVEIRTVSRDCPVAAITLGRRFPGVPCGQRADSSAAAVCGGFFHRALGFGPALNLRSCRLADPESRQSERRFTLQEQAISLLRLTGGGRRSLFLFSFGLQAVRSLLFSVFHTPHKLQPRPHLAHGAHFHVYQACGQSDGAHDVFVQVAGHC